MIERFWTKVDKTDGCWFWTAATTASGYGAIADDGRRMQVAHRVAYELAVGPIPAGLHLDHLCRNRNCVNPAHLEPVTCRTNLLRGETLQAANAAKTHCKRGHEFTPENTGVYVDKRGGEHRRCRECANDAASRSRVRRPMSDEQRAAHFVAIGKLSAQSRRARYAGMVKPTCVNDGCGRPAKAYKGGECNACYLRALRARLHPS
jgi:hypothetical protein